VQLSHYRKGLCEIVNILVRTTDAAGNNALSDPLLIAIYDPNGAFVTAGGWILSPEEHTWRMHINW
jgi:hypothetical protein